MAMIAESNIQKKIKQPKPSSSTNKHDQDDENEEELEYYIDEEFDEQKQLSQKISELE